MKVKEQITLYVLINLKSNLKTSQHTNLYFICAKSTSVVDALQLPSPILCPRVTAILGITFEKKFHPRHHTSTATRKLFCGAAILPQTMQKFHPRCYNHMCRLCTSLRQAFPISCPESSSCSWSMCFLLSKSSFQCPFLSLNQLCECSHQCLV
jgi:hypothetical protein